jgi:hypothetical protein
MLGANFVTEAITAVIITPLVTTSTLHIIDRRHR